jgi:hypothetical protein
MYLEPSVRIISLCSIYRPPAGVLFYTLTNHTKLNYSQKINNTQPRHRKASRSFPMTGISRSMGAPERLVSQSTIKKQIVCWCLK